MFSQACLKDEKRVVEKGLILLSLNSCVVTGKLGLSAVGNSIFFLLFAYK